MSLFHNFIRNDYVLAINNERLNNSFERIFFINFRLDIGKSIISISPMLATTILHFDSHDFHIWLGITVN